MQNDAKQGESEESWNAKRSHAAVLLAAGQSITDTAAAVGVHRNTVAAWSKESAFAKLVEAESSAFLRETRTAVRRLRDKSIATLEAVLDGRNDAARARVSLALLHSLGAIGEPEPIIDKSGNKIVQIKFVNPGKVSVSDGGS